MRNAQLCVTKLNGKSEAMRNVQLCVTKLKISSEAKAPFNESGYTVFYGYSKEARRAFSLNSPRLERSDYRG